MILNRKTYQGIICFLHAMAEGAPYCNFSLPPIVNDVKSWRERGYQGWLRELPGEARGESWPGPRSSPEWKTDGPSLIFASPLRTFDAPGFFSLLLFFSMLHAIIRINFLCGLEKAPTSLVPTKNPLLLTTARTTHNSGFHVRKRVITKMQILHYGRKDK